MRGASGVDRNGKKTAIKNATSWLLENSDVVCFVRDAMGRNRQSLLLENLQFKIKS